MCKARRVSSRICNMVLPSVQHKVTESSAIFLRGCVKRSSSWFEPPEHQMNHRDVYPCLTGFRHSFIILSQPPASAQPGQSSFHHPAPGQRLKPVAVRVPPHNLQHLSPGGPSPPRQLANVGGAGPDQLESGEPAQQLAQNQLGTVPACSWPHVPLQPRASREYPLPGPRLAYH